MFGNLMDKIQNAQSDIKTRLDAILVDGQAEGGMVKVVASGNSEIKQILIDPSLMEDKEAIEELVLVATNKALEKAREIHDEQMKGVAKDLMPGMPNLF